MAAQYKSPMSGEEFEADVTMRVLERVCGILENGASLGYPDWPKNGLSAERVDRAFARFRALRDELNRHRQEETERALATAKRPERAPVPAVDKRAKRAPSRSTPHAPSHV